MKRKLFCELHPITYKVSKEKERVKRHAKNFMMHARLCHQKSEMILPYCLYKHRSLILRKLGNDHMQLQYNKQANLKRVAPKLDGILIGPGEVFSFWYIVGKCSKRKGFLEGVTISNGQVTPGTAGGMCQMTNLIHWLILHSPLDIIEHHHHHRFDLFPDYNRQIPFGTGTSIMYNYLDYRFKNNTEATFQLKIHTTDTHLVGALYADHEQKYAYHIVEENHNFVKREKDYYRCNEIYRKTVDKRTGNVINKALIVKNDSLVLYDYEAHISRITKS